MCLNLHCWTKRPIQAQGNGVCAATGSGVVFCSHAIKETVGGCNCGDAPCPSRLYDELLLTLSPAGTARVGPCRD